MLKYISLKRGHNWITLVPNGLQDYMSLTLGCLDILLTRFSFAKMPKSEKGC